MIKKPTRPVSRFEKLEELLTGTPEDRRSQRAQRHLKASRPRNTMLWLMLHTCARFDRRLPLSDLETRILQTLRRANGDDDLRQLGHIYQDLSPQQRATFFPDQLATLPIKRRYTQDDFREDLKTLVPELLKQPNFRKVDVSELDAEGRVPHNEAFQKATEQFGHSVIQFTAAAGPEARQIEDQSAKIKAVSFQCVRESSEWSNSCEPFFALAGSSDLGSETTHRSQIFSDVDKGENHFFYDTAFAFDGPFDKSVMVEVEIWEKDQGDGWDAVSEAMHDMALACFSGACEMALTFPPAAAVFALASLVSSILSHVFGSCNDDFQINQELTWDRNALLAAAGTNVKVLYDPGGSAGAFEITFAVSVSTDPGDSLVSHAVDLFTGADYQGEKMVLRVQDYNMADLGAFWHNVKSLRMQDGYELTLYGYSDYTGPTKVLRGNAASLDGFQVSSVRVKWAPTDVTLPAAGRLFYIVNNAGGGVMRPRKAFTPYSEVTQYPREAAGATERWSLTYDANGLCTIVNAELGENGGVLGVFGNTTEGSPVNAYWNFARPETKWLLASAGGDYFYLVSALCNKCVHEYDPAHAGVYCLVLGPKANVADTLWRFEAV
jgi:hypothetical protein